MFSGIVEELGALQAIEKGLGVQSFQSWHRLF